VHGVLTCLPTAAAVQDLQRLFYKILNCGLSHENDPPPMLVFNLVAPQTVSEPIY
jgi:hypothetical protein